jgi:hypothetical protein
MSESPGGDGLVIDLIVAPNLPAALVRERAPVEASVHDGDDVGGLFGDIHVGPGSDGSAPAAP